MGLADGANDGQAQPLPPASRDRAGSTRKKRSNTLPRCSGSIVCPWFVTDGYRNPPVVDEVTQQLSAKIVEIAQVRRRFGYRRIHDLLRPDFPGVNHKRVYRLYSQAQLAVRKRKKIRRAASECVPLTVPTRVNEVWSMDFVSDSLANGRRIKCLTVADDFSHECVDIAVDFGISGQYVTRLLDRAAMFRGYPAAVRTDNGPEFTCRAFIAWAQSHGVQHILIQPGRPMQNSYIESFNGKFRDECLNEHWFETLAQARTAIAAWRQDYNEVRPHSSLGRIPPAEFAQRHRNKNQPPPATGNEIK